MNVFAEGIVKYDSTVKVTGVHNIGFAAPLPFGSSMKQSRFCLDDDEQPTLHLLDRVRRELFIDCRMTQWSRDGIFVHVVAAPTILLPQGAEMLKRRKLWLHLVRKEIFHLVKNPNEYEWWSLAEVEKDLLERKMLVA